MRRVRVGLYATVCIAMMLTIVPVTSAGATFPTLFSRVWLRSVAGAYAAIACLAFVPTAQARQHASSPPCVKAFPAAHSTSTGRTTR